MRQCENSDFFYSYPYTMQYFLFDFSLKLQILEIFKSHSSKSFFDLNILKEVILLSFEIKTKYDNRKRNKQFVRCFSHTYYNSEIIKYYLFIYERKGIIDFYLI